MHLRLSLSNSKVKQANLVSSKTPSHQRQICFHPRKFYFILLRDCLYFLFCSCYYAQLPNPSKNLEGLLLQKQNHCSPLPPQNFYSMGVISLFIVALLSSHSSRSRFSS